MPEARDSRRGATQVSAAAAMIPRYDDGELEPYTVLPGCTMLEIAVARKAMASRPG